MKTNVPIRTPSLTTHEGAPAKRIDAEAQLRRSVMACMLWENAFYEDGIEIATRIADLVPKVPASTVTEIAVHARTQQKLRHAPLWLAVSMLKAGGGHRSAVRALLPQIILRADELAEVVALYWKDGRKPLPAALKDGLREAFPRFNEYALAKYNRDGAVKLRDVLFLTHPKPADEEQAAVWKRLVEGTLATPDTWEVALSGGADKKATWERLIAEKQLGGLALLRNLRNMQQVGVPLETVGAALAEMSVERILPFRFVAAARYWAALEPYLELAMFKAIAGMPKLSGRTALLVDRSGSMQATLSEKSQMNRFDAAVGLAILARELCEHVRIIAFRGEGGEEIPPRRGFALRDAMGDAQGGTNIETAKQRADAIGYDRILVLTDEQSLAPVSNPKAPGYMVNVASYKNGVGYGAWNHVDGWSEAIMNYVMACENVVAEPTEGVAE
jgi:hypothetical protein